MKKIISLVFIVVIIALVLGFSYFHPSQKDILRIQTANQELKYHVELALTPEQQQLGLMNRKKLPTKAGMLFLFKPTRVAHMWMKNTLIPLDMVFFDQYGRVSRVHHNAVPHDETIISSGRPVAGVLEINAGEARKYKIGPGTKLDLESFK